MIYFDHAATTPMTDAALSAMLPYFKEDYANASALYGAARKARAAIERSRGQVAQAINAKRPAVLFTSGGSEADNWALFGTANAISARKRIVTSKIEHHAVLHACDELERQGYEVIRLDVDSRGRVSLEQAKNAIDEQTLIVSVMLANNEVGTIQPIRMLSGMAHEAGALMHTDAVQAVGHIPVDVQELNVDLLSMSAHKFGGPKGIGALYVREGTRMDNLIYGGAQERGMRAGTENTPAIVGMGAAIEEACLHLSEHSKQIETLRDAWISLLRDRLGSIRVNGDPEHRLPGIVNVTIPGMSTDALLMRLDMAGIAASAGSACAAGSAERSHVLSAMHLPEDMHQAELRFSFGLENTPDELERAADALARILKR